MHPHPDNRIWIDLEMTGLNPAKDKIIEIALVITDAALNIIAESPALAIYQTEAVLQTMDAWNNKQHNRSGLISRVRESSITEQKAEELMLDFVMTHVPPQKSPMCGNTVCQDRRFLANYMPVLERYFHYRNLDVSVLNELAKLWRPNLIEGFKKGTQHLALADILESIKELKYYRYHFLKCED